MHNIDSRLGTIRIGRTGAADRGTYDRHIKRALDLVFVALVTPLALPLVALAWMLARSDGGPGFFGHVRIGRDGRAFTCWKVRTMHRDAGARLSIDELPQLWNVVRGDMSLVGPRPVTAVELDRYGARRRFYLACRPGLTGLWQVSGRNRLSYDDRIALDQRYAERIGLGVDLIVLVRTVPAVLCLTGS